MGFGGISMWQLLILLLIVVLVFGTKRLRNMGSDLGAAVKGFRKGMDEGKTDGSDDGKDEHDPEKLVADPPPAETSPSDNVADNVSDKGSEPAKQQEAAGGEDSKPS